MEQEKKNQYVLIGVVVILLLVVLSIALFIFFKKRGDLLIDRKVVFNQIYYSEYTLDMIDENYYIGYLDDKQVNVIIDSNGKEVFNNGINIYYDGVYKTKEDNYLIYNNRNNKLVVYLFNGKELEKIYDIDKVPYVKPIIYTNGNIQYIVGFCSNVEDDLYLYMLNDSGVIVINNASLIGDRYEKDVYYTYSDSYLVVSNANSLYGVIDYKGKFVINYKYQDIMNTYNKSFIVKSKDKYGVIDNKNKEIIKKNYKAISLYNDYYLIVDKNNNMALYDKDYKSVVGFEMKYDPLLEFDLRGQNSVNLWHVGNSVVVVNNYLQDVNKTEYSQSNAYFISSGKIVKSIKQIGFENNGLVYSYNKKYEVTVYNSNLTKQYSFKVKDCNKINSISKVTNDIVRVDYIDKNDKESYKYFKNGKEYNKYKYGKVLEAKDDYFVSLDGNKVSIYSNDYEPVDSLEGKKIKYKNGYLIVDNGIYRIEERG